MEETLKIAIIQTTLDHRVAWNSMSKYKPRMDLAEAQRVWDEASNTIAEFDSLDESRKPDIVLLPELTIAKRFRGDLYHWAKRLGCIVIAGNDFETLNQLTVINSVTIVVPYQWPHGKGNACGKSFSLGKRFPAKPEKEFIESCGFTFEPCDRFYILDAGDFGRIGIAICADFYDIERFTLYRGRIQHLFIIAYNKDVKSFVFLAEAISRLVFCNVVICNTGFYGGSLGFSLFHDDYKRYIYRHEGGKLYTSQIIELPVKDLFEAQRPGATSKSFKSQPPSYKWYSGVLEENNLNIFKL